MRDARATRRLILVLDENLSGKSIIQALTKLNIPVKPQTDLMDRGISDEEVLRHLSKHRDCYLLSKDGDFHKRQVEKTALLEHRIGAFVITSQKNKTGPQLVQLIDKAWNRMQQYIQNHHRPFVVKILADGRIQAVH